MKKNQEQEIEVVQKVELEVLENRKDLIESEKYKQMMQWEKEKELLKQEKDKLIEELKTRIVRLESKDTAGEIIKLENIIK